MWTQTPEGQKLIREISKDIMVEVAPEELDMFDELVAEYFQNPTAPDLSAKPKDEPLASGLGEVLIAVTPAAAAMAMAVINHLISSSVTAAKEESAEAIRKKVKTLLNPDKKEMTALDKEQLGQVKKLARKQAVQFGMSEEKAEQMANALIGTLALK